MAGLREPGQREHGQGARRILELEVAVRHLPVRDLVPVPLVDGRVQDLLVPVEADVQQGPGADEERHRNERGQGNG